MSARLETRELSAETWPDFERLFTRGHGWDHCWCMAFQRGPHPSRQEFRTRAEVGPRNHQAKKALVDQGRAHGILVYADGEPVGWCQYGTSAELHGRGQPDANAQAEPSDKVWRVTCFVVDRKHRRDGVAGVALRAALEAIRHKGGGIVEAYPVACWTHGRAAAPGAVFVQGVGPVAPAWGGFGNVSTSGIVSMFEKEGFEAVAVCSEPSARVHSYGAQGCHVLMRRTI
jgi:GNAT superfamily N-acetyltransferase